jgi:hypothetical protein
VLPCLSGFGKTGDISVLLLLPPVHVVKCKTVNSRYYSITVITAATSALTFELTKNKRTAFLAGMAATIVAGAAKELIYDKAMGRGTPELADFGATVMGLSVAVPIRLW